MLLVTIQDTVTGEEVTLMAPEHTFSTGALGWFGGDSITFAGKPVRAQVQIVQQGTQDADRAAQVALEREAKAAARAAKLAAKS